MGSYSNWQAIKADNLSKFVFTLSLSYLVGRCPLLCGSYDDYSLFYSCLFPLNPLQALCLLWSSSGSPVFYYLPHTSSIHLPIQLRLRTPKSVFFLSNLDYCSIPWESVCFTWPPLGMLPLGKIRPYPGNPSATSLLTASPAVFLPPSHLYPPFHLPCKQRVWSPA